MNVCAVRTIVNGFGNDSAKRNLFERPLPHEPKSEPLIAEKLQREPGKLDVRVEVREAECRHCGSIYMEN